MAVSTVKPGKMDDLVAAALDHADALRRQPGCVATYVLAEHEGSTQVSISIFRSAEEFQRAARATRSVITGHHIERFLEGTTTFKLFEVRGRVEESGGPCR